MKASPVTLALLATAAAAFARLGETEAQSIARYGPQDNGLIRAGEPPLLRGARELAFSQPGWRIRAAFADGVTVAIEYQKLGDALDGRRISPEDIKAILEAEKGRGIWRVAGADARKRRDRRDEENARHWERSDRATARIGPREILIQARDVETIAAKLAKQATTAAPNAPTAPKPKF
jgi:hypothetical protein